MSFISNEIREHLHLEKANFVLIRMSKQYLLSGLNFYLKMHSNFCKVMFKSKSRHE